MATDTGKLYRVFIIILLLMNTFFIGTMWMKMMGCGPCGLDSGSAKICPITGKSMKGSVK